MRKVISKNDSQIIFDKVVAYIDNKFPDFTKKLIAENGGDAAVYVYTKGDKKIRVINDCFIDINKIESNFDFEVPSFEE